MTAEAGAAQLSLPAPGKGDIELLAIDGAAYRDVIRGTPLAADLPTAVVAPAEGRLPAIVSPGGVIDGIQAGPTRSSSWSAGPRSS